MKRTFLTCLLTLTLVLTGCAGQSGEKDTSTDMPAVFENQGYRLTVPSEYRDRVIVRTDSDGMLFSAYEKESVEAQSRLDGGTEASENSGAGWLFGIGHVDETYLHGLQCSDMSGVEAFARGGDGSAYLYYHPTDVRVVRDGEDPYSSENMATWTAVCEWAAGVPAAFAEENDLIAYSHSNTLLDITLARMAYLSDTQYELTSLSNGTVTPEGVDPSPYLEALTALSFQWVDNAQTPDGEYIVLNLPEEEVRYDFFLGGDGSYVREVRGEYETLYRAENGADACSPMREWYDALVKANGDLPVDLAAYDDALRAVLDEYTSLNAETLENYDEASHPELPWYTAILANTMRNDLFYGLYDLDGNGVKELIIAAGDDSNQIPEAIYAFDGTSMRYLCPDQPLGERSHLELAGEWFAVRASGGAASGSVALYKIAPDGCSTDLYEIMDYEYQSESEVTYSPRLGNMTVEEFEALTFREFDYPVEYQRFAARDRAAVIGMANPWSDASSLDEALMNADLDEFILPTDYDCFPDGQYSAGIIRFMDKVVEVSVEGGTGRLTMRKSVGAEDISGDYNVYSSDWDIEENGQVIHCHGNPESVRTAWWSNGEFAYSLTFDPADPVMPGLTEAQLRSLAAQIR